MNCAPRFATEETVFRPVLARISFVGASTEEAEVSQFWEKYKDPRWQKKRLQVMEAAGFICEHCTDDSSTLNVHHKFYKKNRDPWDYADYELMCLCETCHELWHKSKNNLDIALGIIDLQEFRHIIGYAIGRAILFPGSPSLIDVLLQDRASTSGLSVALKLTIEEIDALRDEAGWMTSGQLRAASIAMNKPKKSRRKKAAAH